jgi:hypothetical protein
MARAKDMVRAKLSECGAREIDVVRANVVFEHPLSFNLPHEKSSQPVQSLTCIKKEWSVIGDLQDAVS